MFVEEGFRVRFANGEVIDFYADSAADKDGWMKVLSEVVGKDVGGVKSWTDVVLARERRLRRTTLQTQSERTAQRPFSMIGGNNGEQQQSVASREARHVKRGSMSQVPRSMVF